MLKLPNGDKWIIDEKELKDKTSEQIRIGDLPETPIDQFLEQLINSDNIPRKLIVRESTYWDDGKKVFIKAIGGYWTTEHNYYIEILSSLAIRKLTTEYFNVFHMKNGMVYLVYQATDLGSYDTKYKVRVYNTVDEYHWATRFVF